MPFAWGSNDCALFAADCVQALTGEHLCPDLRGYASAKGAMRRIKHAGGLRGLASLALGEPIPVLMAAPGDVVVIRTGKREAMAVCNGGTAIAAGPAGMVAVSMQQALSAWRVG